MASKNPDRPNVLFILSDDQGPWAMNSAGTRELKTPNLDRLAATGVRFDNFFCASPVCSPARASILTGQMPSQHGVQDFLRSGNSAELPADGERIQYLEGRQTYVQMLRDNGYDCGLSGKWHLGDAVIPQAGFEFWDVHQTGSGDYFHAPMFKDGESYYADGYVSDVFTDNAIEYLSSQVVSERPFCMNVHYTAPHAPWGRDQHPEDLYEEYRSNCEFESVRWDPVHPNHLAKEGSAGSIGEDGEDRKNLLSGYFAAITAMDSNIGRLIDWLEANDLRESTLIIFTSDNGMNMGHHGIWGKGNGTYPPNMFDTSVKVPTLLSMPGRISTGEVLSDLLSHYDLMPTILEFAGASPSEKPEDRPGVSFVSSMVGQSGQKPKPVVVHDEYGQTRMIRTASKKYVHRYPSGPNEFWDLDNDPEETINQIDNPAFYQDISELRCQMEEWFGLYTEPERDGSLQNVKGKGQVGLISSETDAFAQDIVFLRDT
ncbi:MAG: sulfatase-like hydrolase/transferase [SAR202 cluster bacterium]|nr:sulfatase-like hydrolase/transferase [SAR202 cluster bacterium]